MPLYEYQCAACGHAFEKIQKFSDALVKVCPSCKKRKVRKLVSSPAFQFKGSGWYATDYAKSGSPGKDDKDDKASEKSEKSESKSDTKKDDGKKDESKKDDSKKGDGKKDSKPTESKASDAKSDKPAKS